MTEICLLDKIPEHELMPVPKSLAGMNDCLHTGNKSLLSDVLTRDVSTPREMSLCGTSCLVIYGQATCDGPWKIPWSYYLWSIADVFLKSVFDMPLGKSFDRIGVTFDRYRKDSIKSGTRKKQTQWQQAHKKSNRKQIDPSTRQMV